jgi:hypothetical protein
MGRKEEEFELFWSLLLGRKVDKKKARMEFVKIKTNLSVQELASRFNSHIGLQVKRGSFLTLSDG